MSADHDIDLLLCHLWLARVNNDAGRARRFVRQARRVIRERLASAPTAKLWGQLGDTYSDSHRAIACYRKALARDPRLCDANYSLAQHLLYTGTSPRRVLPLIDRAAKRPPSYLRWLIYDLARGVYEKVGRLDDAKRMARLLSRPSPPEHRVPMRELIPEVFAEAGRRQRSPGPSRARNRSQEL